MAGKPWDDPEWLPDRAFENATMESNYRPDEPPEQTARRLLIENVAAIALSMVHLATHSQSERIRLNASQYVLERVFADTAGQGSAISQDDQVRLMGQVLTNVVKDLGHDPKDTHVRERVRSALAAVSTGFEGKSKGGS